ncbi:hypothetical protein M8J76_016695 [Diaphorina citri]|nr:hypothetical protein M8J75_001625 [Diaphorina citri]KAI5750562.1 hypothetical protein M8J76_016695 [Diaphorina citri]
MQLGTRLLLLAGGCSPCSCSLLGPGQEPDQSDQCCQMEKKSPLKWCAWAALYCACISFANSRVSDDGKQLLSSFMLSISAVVMSYLQNPHPMTPPWASMIQ